MAGVFTKNMTNVMNVLLQDWYSNYGSTGISFTDWEGTSVTRLNDSTNMRISYQKLAQSFHNISTYTVPPVSSSGTQGFTFLSYGKGTAQPTADDYTVEDLINVLTGSSATCGKTATGMQYTQVITNGTADTVEISEFALFTHVFVSGSDSETIKASIMLYREVLDTPITLEPGQTATFTAELTFV